LYNSEHFLFLLPLTLENDVGSFPETWATQLTALGTSAPNAVSVMQNGLKEIMVAMARWTLSWGAQRTGREADHSPASNAEFKNKGTVYSFPLAPSWRGQRKTYPFVGPV